MLYELVFSFGIGHITMGNKTVGFLKMTVLASILALSLFLARRCIVSKVSYKENMIATGSCMTFFGILVVWQLVDLVLFSSGYYIA